MSPAFASVNRDGIAAAYEIIRPYVRRTPLVNVDAADFGAGAFPVRLKLELLQHSGSFKARGAFCNLLTRKTPEAGVAAASGGNHGVAVSFAAQRLGKRATIFVPTIASSSKIALIKRYGADLHVGGDRYGDPLAASGR